MEVIEKKYWSKQKFLWEKYALEKLGGIVAPKIIEADENKLMIIMTKITFPPLDLMQVWSKGNKGLYNYGLALYELKKTLISKEVDYGDWKNEYMFYDEDNNKLYLIDFDAHETKTSSDPVNTKYLFDKLKDEFRTHPQKKCNAPGNRVK